jgi:HK97 family phage major capsid protein
MEKQDLNALRSIEELTNYQKDVRSGITGLNEEHRGLPFPEEAQSEYAMLVDTDQEIDKRVAELRAREAYAMRLAQNPANVERIGQDMFRATRTASRDEDIYRTDDLSYDERGSSKAHDRARRAVELATFPQAMDRAAAQEHVERLLSGDDTKGSIARRILLTGGPTYQRAFGRMLLGQPMTNEEARALSLAGGSGGNAVPFDLDPTIIPTSNGSVNPLRQISRVVTTVVDTWRGVSSGAITSSYSAEATETIDNAPTLAQPEISTEKAQVFIPFSIEIGMDWTGLRAEMGRLLQDSKDDLEAVKFVTGTGTNEPFGVLVGTTNTVSAAAGADAYTIANLYSLAGALPPRYRPRAAWLGNLAILNRTRRFQTSTDMSNIWADSLQDDIPSRLLGKPAYESSGMPADATTGNKFLLYGDFSRYVIVDRIGLEVELIPHLFGTGHRPTGQRGLYAFWRNGAKVVDANGFVALVGTA